MSDGLSFECYEFMISSPKYSTWQMQANANTLQVCNHKDASMW